MLEELFNRYGCDKSKKHQYHTVYEPQFHSIREQKLNILEVGVFKGASTQAWLEYFPNATLYGLDVFTRIDTSNIEILKDPRVRWLKADSTSNRTTDLAAQAWPDIVFDIIIDDGLHTPRANADTLKNLFPFLKPTGMYFIEDVFPLGIMTQEELTHPWIRSNADVYNQKENQYLLDTLNDKVVEAFDLRKITNEPDSYILKVTK